LLVSGLITYLLYAKRLTRKKRIFRGLIITSGLLIAGDLVIYLFFGDSFFVLRLGNILTGHDSSVKGRTYDAYVIANKLLENRNEYWGVGLGQIKIIGEDAIRSYYLYNKDFVATIPNATAETLAVFGWAGLFIRFLIQFFFFVQTKVWTNYYRLWLFLFMFIFQFLGIFITNIAEYVIWILAFTNVFEQFDVRRPEIKPSMGPLQ